jgi:hypothetical protein
MSITLGTWSSIPGPGGHHHATIHNICWSDDYASLAPWDIPMLQSSMLAYLPSLYPSTSGEHTPLTLFGEPTPAYHTPSSLWCPWDHNVSSSALPDVATLHKECNLLHPLSSPGGPPPLARSEDNHMTTTTAAPSRYEWYRTVPNRTSLAMHPHRTHPGVSRSPSGQLLWQSITLWGGGPPSLSIGGPLSLCNGLVCDTRTWSQFQHATKLSHPWQP